MVSEQGIHIPLIRAGSRPEFTPGITSVRIVPLRVTIQNGPFVNKQPCAVYHFGTMRSVLGQ